MDLQTRLAGLSDAQRRIVLARLQQQRDGAIAAAPRVGDTVPLSFTQERMWFLEQFQPGVPLHVMSGVARLPVQMDPDVFRECLEEVVARHEALRTRFTIDKGAPVAVVSADPRVPLTVLENISRDEMWHRFELAAKLPFDVAVGPLVRGSIALTDDGACFVQLTLHHLVSDGYSTGILFGELGALCAGRFINSRAMLAPLAFQYADYAAWERRRRGRDKLVEYWSDQLAGAPQRLELPADRPRPARMTYRGARRTFGISAAQYDAVRVWSRDRGVTPFVTMLSAYAIVLGRWCHQDDFVIGVPVAHRDEPGTEKVIGPFLNTLALRVDQSGDPTGAELVDRLNAVVLAGYEHQQVPFEQILTAVRVIRDPSRSPLFQAVFNFQADQKGADDAPDMQLTDLHNGCAQFDLLLNLVTSPDGISAIVDYYADVYDESTIDAIIASYHTVLEALIADPMRPVAEFPLISDAAVEAVPATVELSGSALHSVVLETARRYPERIALVGSSETLTYADLDERTRVLAARLRAAAAAAPGATVALCLPRSIDMIVALLAVSRAGYAYVPLDPDYPADRLAFICADADVAAVVSTGALRTALPPMGVPRIELDDPAPPPIPPEMFDLPPADPDRCAYTIYTSGSTGRPKGVRVSQCNAVSLLDAMRVEPGIGPDDVLLSVTSPSFDIALLEMTLPLTVGARIVVADAHEVVDGQRLGTLIDAHSVTIMQATPATWQLMISSGWPGALGLVALCGGEALPPALARGLLERCGALWNMYGPTETTIWSSVHRVGPQDVRAGFIPIGHAIRGTSLHVIDQALNPVPVGVYGELCITGAGVSLGYHQRPELTADRFVTLPTTGGRGYRTGDLVRLRSDGRLEFGGRLDLQVKVRGYRIELGEVETALENCVGVRRAIAAAVAPAPGEPAVLIAGVEPVERHDLQAHEIRAALRTALPEHMVPSNIVVLAQLPLTPNGKVDRQAVIAEVSAAQGREPTESVARVHTAPRTETEQALALIWQELLGLDEPPSVEDDFFELGGHSLLATKLVFRIRDTLAAELPLPVLFGGAVTIARLAVELSSASTFIADPSAELDLAAEAQLAEDVRPDPGAHVHSVRSPQHAFLTGGTGFVGAFLLAEVLRTTEATVFCLVRAVSRTEGLERVRAALDGYGVWDDAYADRIIPVLGTLSRPRLRLSRPEWQHLAAMVDVIYHCGAEVNFMLSYELLKPANVLGTQEILRLACDGSVKPVHFVSTTYVFARLSYPSGTVFTEDMQPIHELAHTFGYTQTKWVSEQMVLEAGRRGVPIWVYRAGRTTGHSGTGACQSLDFIWQATRVAIEMGAAPLMDVTVEFTPVDYVVAAIVHLSRQSALRGKVFHLVSEEPMAETALVEWMEHYGYRGERTEFVTWCERVLERAVVLNDEPAGALAPFLSGAHRLDRMPTARFDARNVQAGLAGTTIACPPTDDDLLRRYFDWFVDSGFLPDPEHARAQMVST